MKRFQPFMPALIGLSCAAAMTGCYGTEGGGIWTKGQVFDHVIVIVLENTDYSTAVADPYLASLASRGALLSNFEGLAHPSYANYLDMVGGKRFVTLLDTQITTDNPSIADTLEQAGLSWKAYAENYAGGCDLTSSNGDYARKHVPFLSFKSIQDSPQRCARVVPASAFAKDVAAGALPNYSFYSPNLVDDGHNTDLPTASKWLKGFLEPVLANSALMKNTLIEITFDESNTYIGNHIYTVLLGPSVKTGFVSAAEYNHFNFLRTVEDNFALSPLDEGDGTAAAIVDAFN